jgi:peptide/nickel transport system permease protein
MNPKITPEARLRLEKLYGLDKPLFIPPEGRIQDFFESTRYGVWLKRIVSLDFGESFSTDRRPVMEKIWDDKQPLMERRLFITFFINALSMLLILVIAIPVGISSAVRRYSLYDKITTIAVFIGFATPSFWLALLLMMFFGIYLDWLPISGLKSMGYESLSLSGQIWDRIRHLILPVFVSSIGGFAGLSRYMRSNMLEVIRQDYIITARAKGLSENKVIYKHALKNALLPIITLLGLSVPGLIGGSVIFENIFMSRDYPLVMGILTIGAALTLIGNLLADIGYMIADPRIRAK